MTHNFGTDLQDLGGRKGGGRERDGAGHQLLIDSQAENETCNEGTKATFQSD